jgi:hypothetical protein
MRGKKTYSIATVIAILLFTLSLASFAKLKDDLYAFPNPFLPPGQVVSFHYILSVTGLLSVDVYDSRGVHIRQVVKMVSKKAAVHKNEEYWDGKNDKGENVPAGVYIVRFDITYSGGATERATILVGLVR